MGKVHPEIVPSIKRFIERQKLYFIASAPNSSSGRVNVSPRSPGESLAVLSSTLVAILDLTGSGAETAAHILENGRMTIMLVNIEDGPPKIVRLHCQDVKLILPDEATRDLLSAFPPRLTQNPGFRAIYYCSVQRVSTSCGFSIPIFSFRGQRTILDNFASKVTQKDPGLVNYRILKNSFSIDGACSVGQLPDDKPPVKEDADENPGYRFGKPLSESDASFAAAADRACQVRRSHARSLPKVQTPQGFQPRIFSKVQVRRERTHATRIAVGIIAFASGFILGNYVQSRRANAMHMYMHNT